jgi:hypothetical protein
MNYQSKVQTKSMSQVCPFCIILAPYIGKKLALLWIRPLSFVNIKDYIYSAYMGRVIEKPKGIYNKRGNSMEQVKLLLAF